MDMDQKRILITGAAGFLGSHLCDKFINEGYHVIGMDNLITGDLCNIELLFKLPQFEFITTMYPNSFMFPDTWTIFSILPLRPVRSII